MHCSVDYMPITPLPDLKLNPNPRTPEVGQMTGFRGSYPLHEFYCLLLLA
jgi:hypothetical protein